MKRLVPVLLSFAVFMSCATHQNVNPLEITQQKVVKTSFDGSYVFKPFIESRTEGPIVPGLAQTLVPQGMAYWKESDNMIISSYRSDGSAGVLSIVSMKSGLLEKVLYLYDSDGTPHTGHLGGLAVSDRYLWIASGPGVYYLDLAAIENSPSGNRVNLSEIIRTETKASFASISEDILWVGEFTRKNGTYPVSLSHHRTDSSGESFRAWLGGYPLDRDTGLFASTPDKDGKMIPDYIFSIPDEIQGAAFYNDLIFLSASFGHDRNSRLLAYHNPMTSSNPDENVADFSGRTVPLWFLGKSRLMDKMIVPPMSEALAVSNQSLALLFESGAEKYRDLVLYSLDRLQLFSLSEF